MTKHVNRIIRLLLASIVFVSLYLAKADFYFSSEIMKISAGYIFFVIGDIISLKINGLHDNRGISSLLCSVVFLSITIGVSLSNDSVLMYDNRYGKLPLFFLSSLTGCASVYMMSRAIKTNKFIEFVGCNTLPFLLFHFFVLMISHVLFHKVMPTVDNMAFPTYLLHFFIAVVACCVYSEIVKKICPWLIKWNK